MDDLRPWFLQHFILLICCSYCINKGVWHLVDQIILEP